MTDYLSQERDRKKAELINSVLNTAPQLQHDQDTAVKRLVDAFAQITPPEPPSLTYVSISVGDRGDLSGHTRKPGNILLNWKSLFQIVPDIVLTTAGTNTPWLIPFACLHIWNTLWSKAKIDLSHDHAILMLVMWQHRNPRNRISESEAFERANKYLEERQRDRLTQDQFAKLTNDLCALQCVELDEGLIWLREWVKAKFEFE